MRTTVTLDDDVAATLRELARRRRVPFSDIVNAVLRRALTAQEGRAEDNRPFRVTAFRSRFRPGVDPLKLNQLADGLDPRRVAGGGPPPRRGDAARGIRHDHQ